MLERITFVRNPCIIRHPCQNPEADLGGGDPLGFTLTGALVVD